MPRTKKKPTPGTQLWLGLFRADSYDLEAEKIVVSEASPRHDPPRATRSWLEGMSRDLKKRFPARLRKRREELNLTQHELANLAQLTATAVAMIERGERVPNLDTAARLCWALDLAAGFTAKDFS
jgi:DNA-binding XRE family transcriptional regulator